MSSIFKTSPDPITIDDPAALLFLARRVQEEEMVDGKVRDNFESCMAFGRQKGIRFPAGVIYASYVRWLRHNPNETLIQFLALNDPYRIYERYLQAQYHNKVVYPTAFQSTMQ